MALGTEEGFVCLFSVTDEGLDFDKVLDKQEGRILCLDWHCDGKVLVTGALSLLLVPFYGSAGHLGNDVAQVVWRGKPEFQSHHQPILKSSLKISLAV